MPESVGKACVQLLCQHLQKPVPNNRPAVLKDAANANANYYVLGHFSHGPRNGITKLTKQLPHLVRQVCNFLRECFPGLAWGSIAVSHNEVAAPHSDDSNMAGSLNGSVSLGSFSGGGLWLHCSKGTDPLPTSDGSALWGCVLPTRLQPCIFHPSMLHATAPFQGDRWAITVFTNRGLWDASREDWELLGQLGFPLPAPQSSPFLPSPQVPESSQSGTTACRVVRMEATQNRDTASQSSRDDTTARQALPSPLPHNLFAQDAAQELAAARPVTWRGRGDLLQVPWAKAAKGRWLVIDLWSGISGVCVTLLSLGLHFHCIAAESDESAVQCARHCFPSVVHVPLVEHITVETIVPYLKRRQIRGIIIGGGSPCQPNSALNRSGKGLQDSRARQPQHLSKLLQAMRQHPLCRDLEIIGFLENVASAEVATVRQYSEWLGGLPIEVDGACCGWARRRRLFWLVGGAGSPDPSKHPAPADWAWQEGVSVHGPSLTYIGTKPIPARIFWEQGFKPLVQPDAVMKGTGQPMHTFTREFYHPEDHIREVSPSAAERFLQDGKRFPPAAYEEHSLLWRKEEWRTPTPEERSQVMGIPPACTEAMQGTAAVRTQKRNSAIGNGFHIPSLLAIFCLLQAVCVAKACFLPTQVATVGIPAQPTDHVAMRVRDTIWEPGYLENFPGILDAAAVTASMRHQFPDVPGFGRRRNNG